MSVFLVFMETNTSQSLTVDYTAIVVLRQNITFYNEFVFPLSPSPPFSLSLSSLPLAISCEILQPPQSGAVDVTGSTPGATARYSCNEGFLLDGQRERVCQADGTYSGRAPICRREFTYMSVCIRGVSSGYTHT